MEKITLKVKRVRKGTDIALPGYMTKHSAGMDLCADVDDDIVIRPLERNLVPTGISIALPDGFEAQIRPRSGLALNHGVTLVNSPGTIDADYRGEIKVILINLGDAPFVVKRGERVAQMVVHQVTRIEWEETSDLGETKRGPGGFGHTGK